MMTHFVALSAVTVVALGVMCDQVLGDWLPGDPNDTAKYLQLAHFAISQHYKGRVYFDTVLEMKDVQYKIVSGTIYHLTFTTAPSACKVGRDQYTAEGCPPTSYQPFGVCTAEVYEVPWQGKLQLDWIHCG